MNNKLDDFLKNKLSVDELGIETPDLSLVNSAREKIKSRKITAPEKENFFDVLIKFLDLKPYQTGLAAIVLIAGFFYFINPRTENATEQLSSPNAVSNYSISSSTVLASLTQYTNNKTATSSSTVLTSIITFVVRN